MNSVSLALKNAGIKVPSLKKRMWLWLKDHPSKNYNEIAIALKAEPSSVASQLGEMYTRGMLSCEAVASKSKKSLKSIKTYSALGREYELLSMPVKDSPCKTHSTGVPVDAPLVKAEPILRPRIDIEQLTVAEARTLYRKLQEMFK
jgi:hypothetical protein